ncbi:uncharacterized protein LOC100835508 isoform X3 [Brachypodium distachyon]|uniref:uncharacterized protein LOC100835508 isoform X3 n=1 Tax=Brachypodium distachyon TaxID=15368 RepID=UPI000D0CAD15|nr:uncharacterized protein LOC100835508 isoform X3 [Brachypodium distachyon]|eukprot:XP_024312369.1 uncharacterized protein LOC100835508 isoform X3 [Brachypodium distachyon]
MPRARAGSRRRARASAWIWSPWRWPAGHLLRGGGRWHRWKKGPLWQRGPRFGFRARRRRGAHGASLTCFVGGSAVLPFFGTEAFIFWCPPSSRRRAVQGFVPLVFLAYGLFVHRFPKLWCLWRHQMWHLASRGYRCVAPDLRGYGGTTVPPDPSSYTVLHIVGDLVALLDALHLHQVFLVVHDQGATVCWNMCLLRPDQVRAVVPSCPRGEVPTATITTSAGSRIMVDSDGCSDEDDFILQPDSKDPDFDYGNRHATVNAGGRPPCDCAGYSSDDYSQTDLIIDNF